MSARRISLLRTPSLLSTTSILSTPPLLSTTSLLSTTLLLSAFLLCGCATPPAPPGKQVSQAALAQAAVAGASKASLLAALGPTHHITFDSGYEAWLYQVPAANGRLTEFVVLLDPAGFVKKTRLRAPAPSEIK